MHSHSTQRFESIQAGTKKHVKFRRLFDPESLSAQLPVEASRKSRVLNKSSSSCRKGRVYCSQMTSCREAKFYLNNYPKTTMDGDGNGIPCESQWCN